jgi:hypothetical protein
VARQQELRHKPSGPPLDELQPADRQVRRPTTTP